MKRFEPDLYYRPQDPAMRLLGTPGSLAVQRCKGGGPPFTRMGRRVLYLGRDLNAWLDAHRVEPRAA